MENVKLPRQLVAKSFFLFSLTFVILLGLSANGPRPTGEAAVAQCGSRSPRRPQAPRGPAFRTLGADICFSPVSHMCQLLTVFDQTHDFQKGCRFPNSQRPKKHGARLCSRKWGLGAPIYFKMQSNVNSVYHDSSTLLLLGGSIILIAH